MQGWLSATSRLDWNKLQELEVYWLQCYKCFNQISSNGCKYATNACASNACASNALTKYDQTTVKCFKQLQMLANMLKMNANMLHMLQLSKYA